MALLAPLARGYARVARAVEGYPLERIGLAAIAAGLVLRLAVPFLMDLRSDGNTYTAMGHAWMLHREFLMPYGDVTTWVPTPPSPSNHYPPAYPFYLGLVFSVFGFGVWQAKWAAVAVSIAALVAAYATTRDLYGRVPAALAGGILALEPHLLWVTGAGFSENMVLLFFALTMWAIVKSLEDDRYIVLAGLCAGLAYLSRASVGYFFVVAGVGGLLWRLYHRGWRVLTNVWYMTAIAVFLATAAWWAVRNALLFPAIPQTWDLGFTTLQFDMPAWETSSYTRYVQGLAFDRPHEWRHALLLKIPFFLAFLAWVVLPFLPESWRATKRIREEETSALWLSVFLVWVIAWAISGMFWVFEKSPMYWVDNHRYVLIGLLPLAWLVLREVRVDRASTTFRYSALLLSLFLATSAVIVSPVRFADIRAGEHLDPYLRAGDEVGLQGSTIKYAFYAYLDRPHEITIYGVGYEDKRPQFVVSHTPDAPEGDYVQVGTFVQKFWNGGVMTVTLWARGDVVAERGVPTGMGTNDSAPFL